MSSRWPKWLPIRFTPLKQLIIFAAPFPKGTPTAPELLVRQPREWAHDVSEVQDLLARAGSARTTNTWPEHPAFGKLSKRAWGHHGIEEFTEVKSLNWR